MGAQQGEPAIDSPDVSARTGAPPRDGLNPRQAPLLVLGLFPVFGQTVVPVLQTLVAGFFLSVELLAIPLERRGLHLGGRLRFVWRHRGQTLGFGLTAFFLFLVPLMNVLALPGAVVGATLLVRRLSGDPAGPPGPR